ncbi:hypothetical protein Tdes44962_MAKER01714 [Teratosphaeria destructans]|uniref:Uncharacterized protein n=1 Tax=Teratosphaeria destructans TaxID=418781 RepID=A0A9W7W579_9PEZI|nr:hypothetical protein Tdes44962_MAKER01714 [Teratosphaeria destructans]
MTLAALVLAIPKGTPPKHCAWYEVCRCHSDPSREQNNTATAASCNLLSSHGKAHATHEYQADVGEVCANLAGRRS